MLDYTFRRSSGTPRSAQLEGQDQQQSQPTLAGRSSKLRTVALRSGRHDDGQSGSIRSSAPFSERTMASFAAKLDQAAAGARPTQGTCQWLACRRGPLDFHHGHVRCNTAHFGEGTQSDRRHGTPTLPRTCGKDDRPCSVQVLATMTSSTSLTYETQANIGFDPGRCHTLTIEMHRWSPVSNNGLASGRECDHTLQISASRLSNRSSSSRSTWKTKPAPGTRPSLRTFGRPTPASLEFAHYNYPC